MRAPTERAGEALPWERRHRRPFDRMGLYLAIGGAVVIIVVIVTVVLSTSTPPPGVAH
jgi:hypothetical protein